MATRTLRLLLLASLIASAVVAGRLLQEIDRRAVERRNAADAASARLVSIIENLGAIGAAQQSYVALGQQAEPWFERMSSRLQQVYDDIAAVRPLLRSDGSEAGLDRIVSSTEALLEADTRARENLRLGQQLMAADVIFSDGLNTLETMIAEARALRQSEQASHAAAQAALARERWNVLVPTAALWAIAALILTVATARRAPAPLPAAPPQHADAVVPDPVPPGIDLAAAASLCTDLSRMSTAAALTDLLGRAAAVLKASGVILWLGAGEELFAVTAHGYPAEMIARLRPLSRADQNAAASAWRTGQVTTVAGDGVEKSALVAPMFGPDSCIGVLAIELEAGRQPDADIQAVARMLTAQLATGLSAWPAASSAQPAPAAPADAADEPELRSASSGP